MVYFNWTLRKFLIYLSWFYKLYTAHTVLYNIWSLSFKEYQPALRIDFQNLKELYFDWKEISSFEVHHKYNYFVTICCCHSRVILLAVKLKFKLNPFTRSLTYFNFNDETQSRTQCWLHHKSVLCCISQCMSMDEFVQQLKANNYMWGLSCHTWLGNET